MELAWTRLARKLVGRSSSVPFLARLCRTSLGRGDPTARAGTLRRLIEWAGEVDPTRGDAVPLAAFAAALRADDGQRIGRDWAAAVADSLAGVFDGTRPAAFAEHLLAAALECPDPVGRRRLRVLLLAAAFDAGLTPHALADMAVVLPSVGRAVAAEPGQPPGLLYAAWQSRRPGDVTVFDLCRSAPRRGGELLADHPDLLFVHHPSAALETAIGPFFLCGRGVMVGGTVTANPDAPIGVARTADGYELTLGSRAVPTPIRPTAADLEAIRNFIRFRAETLLPLADRYLEPTASDVRERVLRPLSRPCPVCGRRVAAARGEVGVVV